MKRVQGISARSVYRSAGRMEACGLLDRYTVPGVPPKTLIRLTHPAGHDLLGLVRSFTDAHATYLPEQDVEGRWSELALLGQLWEDGFVEELSRGPRSLSELAAVLSTLTYYQVKRRMTLALRTGFLGCCTRGSVSRQYGMTARGRRCMALVCGIGRWRRRHVLSSGAPGLETAETATVLRTVLPLASLPEYVGSSLELRVVGPLSQYGYRETEPLRVRVERGGSVIPVDSGEQPANGYAAATINIWMAVLLEHKRGRIRLRGDTSLAEACLARSYKSLWDPDDGDGINLGSTPTNVLAGGG
jgi:hypothetical protein